MPIVQLYLRGEHTDEQKRILIEKISEAIVAAGCGPIDRVRIIIQELAGSIQNDGSAVVMDHNNGNHLPILKIFVIEGRTNDVKEALSDRLAVTLAEAGYGRDTVQVSVHDIPSSAWGIGGKTARDLGR